jgi:hypothetical protein
MCSGTGPPARSLLHRTQSCLHGCLPHCAQVLLNQFSLRAADRAVVALRATLAAEEAGTAAKAVAAAADERRARQVNAFTDCMG